MPETLLTPTRVPKPVPTPASPQPAPTTPELDRPPPAGVPAVEPPTGPARQRGGVPARPGGGRLVRRGLGFGGSIGALILFCASLTPSLLPRHWVLQAVVSGLTMAIGYGAGASVGALARRIWPRLPSPPTRAWVVLALLSGGTAMVFLQLAAVWQRDLRQLMGMPPAAWEPLLVAVVAGSGFALLLAAARGVRLATRVLVRMVGRRAPQPVAAVTAVAIVATLGYGLGHGVVFNGFVDATNRSAATANAMIAPDVARPSSPYVSGGPGSLVPWETLGAQGRAFIAGAVPTPALADFAGPAGGAAAEPIRVYVGHDSTSGVAQRAQLAVRELERTGAFDREVIAVVTTTGTGWVNPVVASSLEYLHDGDTALVAMQYSYLPSWVSFLAEREAAVASATALISAVQQRVAEQPAGSRPRLVVYGESLGAYGTEAAFGQLSELLGAVDGALLAGPPHTSPIRRQVSAAREAGTPVWRPGYAGGDTVRFAQHTGDLTGDGNRPRVVYLQNASDPIAWWSPELLYRKPAWLEEPRGPDVSGHMRWFPVVTFWQVTVDLVAATGVPDGHGHSYRESIVDGWAALVPPPGWTAADTDRLRTQVISAVPE